MNEFYRKTTYVYKNYLVSRKTFYEYYVYCSIDNLRDILYFVLTYFIYHIDSIKKITVKNLIRDSAYNKHI